MWFDDGSGFYFCMCLMFEEFVGIMVVGMLLFGCIVAQVGQ